MLLALIALSGAALVPTRRAPRAIRHPPPRFSVFHQPRCGVLTTSLLPTQAHRPRWVTTSSAVSATATARQRLTSRTRPRRGRSAPTTSARRASPSPRETRRVRTATSPASETSSAGTRTSCASNFACSTARAARLAGACASPWVCARGRCARGRWTASGARSARRMRPRSTPA